MGQPSKTGKYVHINPRLSAIELDLPPELQHHAAELREKIAAKFSFTPLDSDLEHRIQAFIEEYLTQKGLI